MWARLSAGEKPNRKRMAALAAVYDAESAKCRPHSVIAPPGGRCGVQAGWPIATGIIEGACRHLIADRLDLGGARWGLDGAEAVLTLRAVISHGDFEECWRFHLARAHQRLYPATTQGQYALSA